MKDLSICITIKNRCIIETEFGKKFLFRECLKSIENSCKKSNLDVEVIISDFMSDDVENLEKYTNQYLSFPFKVIQIPESFSRGKGLNISESNSSSQNLLFLDADMKFNENFIKKVAENTIKNGDAYFPICFTHEKDPTEKTGFWLTVGFGNVSVRKKDFIQAGRWQEKKSWGKEDSNFFTSLKCKKVRENCDGLIHQWHPFDLKFKFYEEKDV